MRIVLILALQVAISVFVAASVMPMILVTMPAAQTEPRLGLGLMIGSCVLCFVVLALIWPPRRRKG